MTTADQMADNTAETEPKAGRLKPRAGISDFLAGEAKDFKIDLRPYLPQDLIGGSVPHIPGMDDESVWNAASQACGTEKVHYVYSVDGSRVWYLACPSAALASNPDSWCPLAAALPGYSEHWDKETVYLYEQEGTASALRWDPETGRIQVFLGASRTILPRVRRAADATPTVPRASARHGWSTRIPASAREVRCSGQARPYAAAPSRPTRTG